MMSDSTDSQRWYLRLPDGKRFGPATEAQLCEWARQGRIPREGALDPEDGGAAISVMSNPQLARILAAPPTVHAGAPVGAATTGGGAFSGLIPYHNKPALIGYYCGVAALLPLIGVLPGVVALVLGFIGLFKRIREPQSRGLAHAIVAIVLGLAAVIGWPALFILALMG